MGGTILTTLLLRDQTAMENLKRVKLRKAWAKPPHKAGES